jgi:hypothetical protein
LMRAMRPRVRSVRGLMQMGWPVRRTWLAAVRREQRLVEDRPGQERRDGREGCGDENRRATSSSDPLYGASSLATRGMTSSRSSTTLGAAMDDSSQ